MQYFYHVYMLYTSIYLIGIGMHLFSIVFPFFMKWQLFIDVLLLLSLESWAEHFHKIFHIIQEEKLNEEIERMLQKISEFVEVVEMVSTKSSIFSHDGCFK